MKGLTKCNQWLFISTLPHSSHHRTAMVHLKGNKVLSRTPTTIGTVGKYNMKLMAQWDC